MCFSGDKDDDAQQYPARPRPMPRQNGRPLNMAPPFRDSIDDPHRQAYGNDGLLWRPGTAGSQHKGGRHGNNNSSSSSSNNNTRGPAAGGSLGQSLREPPPYAPLGSYGGGGSQNTARMPGFGQSQGSAGMAAGFGRHGGSNHSPDMAEYGPFRSSSMWENVAQNVVQNVAQAAQGQISSRHGHGHGRSGNRHDQNEYGDWNEYDDGQGYNDYRNRF